MIIIIIIIGETGSRRSNYKRALPILYIILDAVFAFRRNESSLYKKKTRRYNNNWSDPPKQPNVDFFGESRVPGRGWL